MTTLTAVKALANRYIRKEITTMGRCITPTFVHVDETVHTAYGGSGVLHYATLKEADTQSDVNRQAYNHMNQASTCPCLVCQPWPHPYINEAVQA